MDWVCSRLTALRARQLRTLQPSLSSGLPQVNQVLQHFVVTKSPLLLRITHSTLIQICTCCALRATTRWEQEETVRLITLAVAPQQDTVTAQYASRVFLPQRPG